MREAKAPGGGARAFFTSERESARLPVAHMPMPLVILNIRVTLLASSSLSGTFFWVTTTTLSLPRTYAVTQAGSVSGIKK